MLFVVSFTRKFLEGDCKWSLKGRIDNKESNSLRSMKKNTIPLWGQWIWKVLKKSLSRALKREGHKHKKCWSLTRVHSSTQVESAHISFFVKPLHTFPSCSMLAAHRWCSSCLGCSPTALHFNCNTNHGLHCYYPYTWCYQR